jgi:phosphatidylinositol alpha-1,6-mannosyltransferase
MNRIALLTTDLPPRRGGVARYHAAVCAALGTAVTVIQPPETAHWRSLVRNLIRRRRTYDHVLVGDILPYGTVAWIARWVTRRPYTIMCHGLDLRNAKRVPRKRWLARRILRAARRVIVNSTFTATIAESLGAPFDRIVTIPPPLGVTPAMLPQHAPDVRAAVGIGAVDWVIVSVGRLVERKGFDILIRAVAMARRAAPSAPIVLVIVGTGPERAKLQNVAKTVGVEVRWVSDADDAMLASWYAACDCFALLPHELPDGDVEGFGIVYLEAGAFAKPVIGTRSGGVPEAVQNGVTGVLVAPNDPQAAADALLRLLTDRAFASRLGQAGADRARNSGDAAVFAERIRNALV